MSQNTEKYKQTLTNPKILKKSNRIVKDKSTSRLGNNSMVEPVEERLHSSMISKEKKIEEMRRRLTPDFTPKLNKSTGKILDRSKLNSSTGGTGFNNSLHFKPHNSVGGYLKGLHSWKAKMGLDSSTDIM